MNQLVLSPEQMRYLIHNLGISNCSPSVIWIAQYNTYDEFCEYTLESLDPNKDYSKDDIPTFTIVDLLKLLPQWQMNNCTGGYEIYVKPLKWDMALPFPKAKGSTPIMAIYNIVCLLARKNLF